MVDDPRPADQIDEAWRRMNLTPLESGSPWYVDCSEERGIHNFVQRMVQDIDWCRQAHVHTLVVGHRGTGKSTELRRLTAQLQERGFYVHYVDMEDHVRPDEIDCEAILTVVLGTLVEDLAELRISLNDSLVEGIANWYGQRVKVATDSRSSGVEVKAEVGLGGKTPLLSLFTGFLGDIRTRTGSEDKVTVQYLRYLTELREQVDPLLTDANLKLQKRHETPRGLVVIVDSLERMPTEERQDEVFIESAAIITGLSTHLVLTAPAALLAAGKGSEVANHFDRVHWLPVVKVRTLDGDPYPEGLAKMRQVILERCSEALFEEDALDRICTYSGGHTRHLIRLAQDALSDAGAPPVRLENANRAVAGLSNLLAYGRRPEEWATMAAVECDPLDRRFSDEGRVLLYYDCILTHENASVLDENNIPQQWYMVHPCLRRLKPFKDALEAAAKS